MRSILSAGVFTVFLLSISSLASDCPKFAFDPELKSSRLSFDNSTGFWSPVPTCYPWSLLERSLLQGAIFNKNERKDSKKEVEAKIDELLKGEPQIFNGVESIEELSKKYKKSLEKKLKEIQTTINDVGKYTLTASPSSSKINLKRSHTYEVEYFATEIDQNQNGFSREEIFRVEGRTFVANNDQMYAYLKGEIERGNYPILSLRTSAFAHAVLPISVKKISADEFEIKVVNPTYPELPYETIRCSKHACELSGETWAALGYMSYDSQGKTEGLSQARCDLQKQINNQTRSGQGSSGSSAPGSSH